MIYMIRINDYFHPNQVEAFPNISMSMADLKWYYQPKKSRIIISKKIAKKNSQKKNRRISLFDGAPFSVVLLNL
jgi:hypothetical protein